MIALPQGKDRFELGRPTRSLDDAEAELRRLAGAFTIPQRVIDKLQGKGWGAGEE